MLEYLKLTNLGPAPALELRAAERFNIITGDNGLGKSFLLDIAWWALTRTWVGAPAMPEVEKDGKIEYRVRGKTASPTQSSSFRREDQSWPIDAKRPPMPGVVVYIRIDGGFSVWDPARNYWRKDPGRPAAYHFAASEVWDGLGPVEHRVCEGLERDWVNWQSGRKSQFKALEEVLRILSPPGEPMVPGAPRRLYVGEGRDRPTLSMGGETVPLAFASAGVRRSLALAYFLVWAWTEHREAARLLGKEAEERIVILFDEPETHLHPRWQRSIIPSLVGALQSLMTTTAILPQVFIATHSPLVIASLEPIFDSDHDDLMRLERGKIAVELKQDTWAPEGDVTNWLVSETFGLEQARSIEAERVIEAAETFMRGEPGLPPGLDSRDSIHEELLRYLPGHDAFWPRWLVETASLPERRKGS